MRSRIFRSATCLPIGPCNDAGDTPSDEEVAGMTDDDESTTDRSTTSSSSAAEPPG